MIVGIATSIPGLQALRCAVREARQRGAVLCAARAWQYPSSWQGPVATRARQQIAQEAAATLGAAFAMALGGMPADSAVRTIIVDGPPHRVLIAQASIPRADAGHRYPRIRDLRPLPGTQGAATVEERRR